MEWDSKSGTKMITADSMAKQAPRNIELPWGRSSDSLLYPGILEGMGICREGRDGLDCSGGMGWAKTTLRWKSPAGFTLDVDFHVGIPLGCADVSQGEDWGWKSFLHKYLNFTGASWGAAALQREFLPNFCSHFQWKSQISGCWEQLQRLWGTGMQNFGLDPLRSSCWGSFMAPWNTWSAGKSKSSSVGMAGDQGIPDWAGLGGI